MNGVSVGVNSKTWALAPLSAPLSSFLAHSTFSEPHLASLLTKATGRRYVSPCDKEKEGTLKG